MNHYPRLDEQVYRRVLPNGLALEVVKKPGFAKKQAYFVTDFGSIHTHFRFEGKEHRVPAGIAHYLEHKMFDLPDGRDVSAEFAALGASSNAFTSYDMTAYYFSCTDHFEQCLRLLLEFVSTPYFTEESVEKERGIIDQEIGMNLDAADSVVFEITPENLTLCHRAFYTPGNMMLCVMGDVDPEAVEKIARELLGDAPREVGEKLRDWDEPPEIPLAEVEDTMEVAMPTFTLAFRCPPPGRGDQAIRLEFLADLAAEALFGESSELYLKLYDEGSIDSSFGGGFETIDGCAMLTCGGDSYVPEQVRSAVLAGAEAFSGLSEESFRRMKRSAFGRRVKGLDSFDATCFRVCAYHFSDFDYFRFPEIYDTIQKEDVTAFLKETVRAENACLSVIRPVQGGEESC